MANDTYDVLIIGGGPGGYVAAIRAAQLGLRVACIDKWKNAAGKTVYGGTCLNVGCIPSKALLESSYNYARARDHFAEHGVMIKDASVDLARMQKRKEKVVAALVGGIGALFRKNKVAALEGEARIKSLGDVCEVEINNGGETTAARAKHLIIATGSVPRAIPPAPADGDKIVDSEGALAFAETPAKLGVVGAGVIGLELGSVWARLGSEVTVLEALPDFLPAADAEIAGEGLKIFKKQGLRFHFGAMVEKTEVDKKGVDVFWRDGGRQESARFDKLIVAVGRAPFSDNLGAREAGIAFDDGGFIKIDAQCRTNVANVFAVGDIAGGAMLAHKAEEEGMMAAELIAGQKPEVNYEAIPWVIYTHPEVAWVGQTEQALQAAGARYRKGSFPFLANGRARGLGETGGMVKMLADEQSDRILGVHILGGAASEMIAEAALAMEFGAAAEDIARTCHAHPTLSEVFREAALAVDGRAIHI